MHSRGRQKLSDPQKYFMSALGGLQRVLPPDYRQFTHGYAVTSHASQGKTVDQVLLLASSRSFGAVSREQFYVSISLGRQRCRIFTDDRELLRERITRSGSRKSALELAGLEAALAGQGFKRKAVSVDSSPSSIPEQQLHTIAHARRLSRFTRLSQRLAHAFTTWTALVKHTVLARFMRPAIRRTPQHTRAS